MSVYKSRHSGFTLLEVLIAMSILAMTMIALIQTTSLAASSETHIQEKVLAQWVALNQITSLQLSKQPVSVGVTENREDMAGRSWRWQADISQTSNPRLFKVVIDVGHAGQDDKLYSLTGYLGQKQ